MEVVCEFECALGCVGGMKLETGTGKGICGLRSFRIETASCWQKSCTVYLEQCGEGFQVQEG